MVTVDIRHLQVFLLMLAAWRQTATTTKVSKKKTDQSLRSSSLNALGPEFIKLCKSVLASFYRSGRDIVYSF